MTGMHLPEHSDDALERIQTHMDEFHDVSTQGFTTNQLLAEHLLLHQYEHGIPEEGTPHDLDHQKALKW